MIEFDEVGASRTVEEAWSGEGESGLVWMPKEAECVAGGVKADAAPIMTAAAVTVIALSD